MQQPHSRARTNCEASKIDAERNELLSGSCQSYKEFAGRIAHIEAFLVITQDVARTMDVLSTPYVTAVKITISIFSIVQSFDKV